MKRTTQTVEIDGKTLVLSNLDKVLWPQDGITKGELIAYYRAVAPWLLAHLQDRPLTLERYPNGIEAASFFEKNAPRGFPTWAHTVAVPSESGRRDVIDFVICNDEPTLVYLANLAAIVLHIWTSREGSLESPDFVLLDLDPDEECTLATLGRVALQFRESLAEIGIAPLVKTTGGYGLHLVVPLIEGYSYEVARAFAELLAHHVHDRMPEQTTLLRMPAKRPRATVYLDYVQVGEGKTLVAPYAVRARPQAPVSMPIPWEHVEVMSRSRARDTQGAMRRYTIANVPKLLARDGDLWSGKGWVPQRLEPALALARKRW
ncbi:MAG TPA: non-homologous end-joining DNA ligase [Candidatus Acidoferrales bacterium]|nr:non-homologous end-joining DNA ligase [Candidatus Acidoferrales bacterium]